MTARGVLLVVVCALFVAPCRSGGGDPAAPGFTATITDSAGTVWDLAGEAEFLDLVEEDGDAFLVQMLGSDTPCWVGIILRLRSRLPASGRYPIASSPTDSTFVAHLVRGGYAFPEDTWSYASSEGEVELESSTYDYIVGTFRFAAQGFGPFGRGVSVQGRFAAEPQPFDPERRPARRAY